MPSLYAGMASDIVGRPLPVTPTEDEVLDASLRSDTNASPGVLHHIAGMAVDVTADLGTANAYHDNITAANQAHLSMLLLSAETGRSNRERARTYTALEGRQDRAPYLMDVSTIPLPAIPVLEFRGSTGTTSTARSSYGTVDTRGSSMTSMSSDGRRFSDETAPLAHTSASCGNAVAHVSGVPPPAQVQLPVSGPLLFCLCCNIGSGHITGPYTRRSGNTPTTAVPTGMPVSDESFVRPRNSWFKASAFDKHMLELHEGLFKRRATTEYICIFCPCPCPSDFVPNCPGRFWTFQDLLVHLRVFHAQNTNGLAHHHHCCFPLAFDVQLLVGQE